MGLPTHLPGYLHVSLVCSNLWLTHGGIGARELDTGVGGGGSVAAGAGTGGAAMGTGDGAATDTDFGMGT